jgi:hypothetical protein
VTPTPRGSVALALRTAALCLLAALPLTAQQDDKFDKLDPACRFSIEQVMDSANAVELPATYLRSTALQGIALRADCRKIVDAVRKDYAWLKSARASLGPASDEELVAAAAVLRAGAKPNQLAPFKARQKGRSDVQAFTIWADLMTRGVPGEEASSAIAKLWQDGADDDTFRGLWNGVQTDIVKGLNPGAALQNRIRETPGRPTPNKVTPPEGPQENLSSR